jgi:hypothetical protein
MELQKGNWWAAVRLLERCVLMDPANSPVLRWHPVAAARKTVGSRSRRARDTVEQLTPKQQRSLQQSFGSTSSM